MSDPSAVISVLVRIEGRVQGVWYRGWAEGTARRRGLSGWVRNRADGSVEALFSGAGADVEAMLEDCRKGPPAARVTTVAPRPADPPDTPGFRTLPTL